MKIYITGIMGMLSYGLAESLKNRAEVVGIDIVDGDYPDIHYAKISLFDMKSVADHIRQEQPDILIHTAAMVNVDECEENPRMAETLNTRATAELAQICNRLHHQI